MKKLMGFIGIMGLVALAAIFFMGLTLTMFEEDPSVPAIPGEVTEQARALDDDMLGDFFFFETEGGVEEFVLSGKRCLVARRKEPRQGEYLLLALAPSGESISLDFFGPERLPEGAPTRRWWLEQCVNS